MDIKMELKQVLENVVKDLIQEEIEVQIEVSSDLSKGDFTTNIAMRISKQLGNPMNGGEKIVEKIREDKNIYSKFSKIELVNPGFINFWLSNEEIEKELEKSLKGYDSGLKDVEASLILEFGDLNPFKEPHIGHVRNLVLGESLARLFEFNGVKVVRVNYEGDVGMHVAKCLWGIEKADIQTVEAGSLEDKAKFLGSCYAIGAKAFDSAEQNLDGAKAEIVTINKKIYLKDPEILEIWEKGRKWSLEYFEELYEKLGVKYEKYYFESQTAEPGKEIVESHPDVFEKDDRALIFRGENYGLHTRVFVNSEGNPTYEAKDLALAVLKNKDFPDIGKSIIMTANEQIEYFKVLLKALGKTDAKIAEKTEHLSFGFVNLKEGKMSSRTGQVVGANWLLEEVRERLETGFKEVSDEVLDMLSVGAVKWSMLKFSRESDISFSIEESIDLAGNSGPYMQYSYARICSLMEKASDGHFEAKPVKSLEGDLLALARIICQFEGVTKNASEYFSPNYLTDYLFRLAQMFNAFYEKEKVIGAEDEESKLAVIYATGNVLKKGLDLLGISAPERI